MRYKISLVAFAASLLLVSSASAWTGPTSAPPNGNASAPVNISATAQTKSGVFNVTNGLTVGGTTLWAGGSGGNVGIGNSSPSAKLDVTGNVNIGGNGVLTQRGPTNSWAQFINWPPPADSSYGILVGSGNYSQFQNDENYYTILVNSSWGVMTNGNVYSSDYYIASLGQWVSNYRISQQLGPTYLYAPCGGSACQSSTCPSGGMVTGVITNYAGYDNGLALYCRDLLY